MKKLLSIVALALILCLGISAVLADSFSEEIYRANIVGLNRVIKYTSDGYPILTIEEIQNPDTWLISEGDYQPLPSSDEAKEPAKAENLLSLFVSSANAEEGDTYGVDLVIIGNIEHAKPTMITVANEASGISAAIMVMIEGNEHVNKTEWTVEDGWCYSQEVCTICGYATEWKKAPPHKPGCTGVKIVEGKTVVVCEECGQVISTYDGHAHDAVIFCDEIPTCLNGFTGTYHYACSICGLPLKTELDEHWMWEVADEIGPFIQWTVSNDNAEEYGHIDAADYYVWEADNAEPDLVSEWWADRYDGHLWSNWSELSAPNCTENGWLIRTCWWCKAEQVQEDYFTCYGIEYYPVEVACNSTDELTLLCMHCNGLKGGEHKVVFANGIKGMSWDEENGDKKALGEYLCNNVLGIPAIWINHSFDPTKPADYNKPATCTEVGFKGWNCLNKNDGCVEDGNEVFYVYQQELGHDLTDWIVRIAPDFDHNIQGVWIRTCKRPGCPYTERFVGTEAEDPTINPETCAHVLVEVDVVPATCTEDGTITKVCTICGTYVDDVLPKKGHVYDAANIAPIQAATCVADGVGVVECERCGALVKVAIPATGHDMPEVWTLVTPATVDADGVEERKCTKCDYKETRAVPFVATEKADYTVSEFVYDMNAQEVTGNVAHVAGTKTLENVFARISFYYKDKTWAAFVVPVNADGSFFMGANTDAAYVKVNIVDNAKATQIPEEEDVYGNGNAKIIPLD